LAHVLAELARDGVEVLDIGLRRPTLDDVFLTLTGRATAADEPGAAPPGRSRGRGAARATASEATR
jgi:ABC-2 type transport system ATP-binding protein